MLYTICSELFLKSSIVYVTDEINTDNLPDSDFDEVPSSPIIKKKHTRKRKCKKEETPRGNLRKRKK